MGKPGDEKPADENLPEVVVNPVHPPRSFDHTPEVVSPEDATAHVYFTERDKYPAHYDDAPKLTYDPNDHTHSNGQAWPVSALSPATAMPWESLPPADEANINNPEGGGKSPEKRICGLRRRTFIIVMVVLVVIIAAAVGGGVGATRARSGSGSSSTAESGVASASVNPATTSPATTTSTSSTTTTSSTPPTQTIDFLNNQTDARPQSFQGHEEENYKGKFTGTIREEGYHDFAFNITSYVWLNNATDCCITFCANKTKSVGWRCDPRYREKADEPFPRIYIWCDRARAELHKDKCSDGE